MKLWPILQYIIMCALNAEELEQNLIIHIQFVIAVAMKMLLLRDLMNLEII